jgi:signal transduction histidine kinase/DNA-binding response OmpR family regulator
MVEGCRAEVLLVDDRPEQRLALATVLAELDVNVVEAASGREALRHLLQRDFAVVLLDVHMPGMDGFETAALIRGRRSSEHVPIIFVTAFGDDDFALRGYSLGAVDYVTTPLNPQVLRSKVSVFVDLFQKSEQLKRQAASLEAHAAKLERLAEASIQLHAARHVDALLEIVADSAVALIDARQVSVSLLVPPSAPFSGSRARLGRRAVRRPQQTALDRLEREILAAGPGRRVRMARDEAPAPTAAEELPLAGWLVAPLSATDGASLGWLQLSDRQGGEFGAEDELLLVQLAQMASIAAENIFFDEAREANRLKDQFLATLSHELRTPLQTILTWACMLRQDEGEPDAATLARGLEVIERNARTQTRLIEDLLDVSRIVTGKLELELHPLPVDETLEAAFEDARALAQERGVELTLASRCPGVWLHVDAHRLRQVLGNVISNAIKFTPKGGRATLAAALQPDDTVEISVTDTGKGIDPSFLPHLFEPFRQADSSSTRAHSGLGIGLAIVRHLTELQGGTVRAESEGEGRGARFVLRFPLGKAAAVAGAEQAFASAPTDLREPDLRGVRVLVVDDEADARASIELTLKQYGAEVVAVPSAAEAIAALERDPVDVLCSDLAMPGEDGLSLIRRVRARKSEASARLPAAALSAYGRAEDFAATTAAGFDVHLPKPIEPIALAAAIERLAAGGVPGRVAGGTAAREAASKPACR